VRYVWISAGTIFLAIGVAGVILPMLPGTVFLLIASACYLRGSKRLYDWLMGHPVLGRQVRIMTGELPMPLRSKVTAISAMWIAVTISLFANRIPALQIILAALAVFGTWFILKRR
jgi:hypothetical protein